MRLEILLLNKTKDSYLQQGVADYLQRLRRYAPVELIEIKLRNLTSRSDSEIKAQESALLDRRAAEGSYRIALDSRGQQYSSEEFATLLTELENRAIKRVSFIIGGPLGLAVEQLQRADQVLSLSALTFTHDMTRLILLEQIYRAYTIKAGTSYHK
jgi:23S rRNA (pseudouridine1915-N3)-methyltransferase